MLFEQLMELKWKKRRRHSLNENKTLAIDDLNGWDWNKLNNNNNKDSDKIIGGFCLNFKSLIKMSFDDHFNFMVFGDIS